MSNREKQALKPTTGGAGVLSAAGGLMTRPKRSVGAAFLLQSSFFLFTFQFMHLFIMIGKV